VRAAIFLNGVSEEPDLLLNIACGADLILAADGGTRHALEAGLIPDIVVGDMDSLGDAGAREAEKLGARLESYPSRKDKMDGHLAVIAACERGATELDFLCAFGEKLSAVFAIPHLLLAAERMGLRAAAIAGWGRMFALETASRTVTGSPGDGVSVFSLTGSASGVNLEGFVYPLEDARLEAGDTLGFHNRLSNKEGRVSVREGALLVIHELEGDSR
jgi:thiamine pyrophosphokinase